MNTVNREENKGIIPIFKTLGVPVYLSNIDNEILFEGESGVTYLAVNGDKTKYRVVIRKDLPLQDKQFVLAHELGHIVMGHLVKGTPAHIREPEADKFASFIMPYIYEPVIIGGSNG